MFSIDEIVATHLERAKFEIIANMRDQRRIASGRTTAGLRVVTEENYAALIDTMGTLAFNEYGSGPARKQPAFPSKVMVGAIEQWMKDKGVRPRRGGANAEQSMAYAIAMRIVRSGNRLHRSRRQSGVVTDVINGKFIERIASDIKDAAVEEVYSQIIRELK